MHSHPEPQLLIRNATNKSISAALRFNWRSATGTGKATGPTVQLAPYQTQRVDVAALQKAGTLPLAANWTSVTLVTNSLPDEVMAVAASYDSALRYGAQTPFSDQLTFRWEGGMWEYDAYHDSIITAGNGGTQPINAAFRIFYNQGTKMYELDQSLQPDDQMWIDVGRLIREQVPDKTGTTLPANLASGSYEFRDLTHNGAGTLFEGKVIYDKMYGHAAYGCALCCGWGENTQLWYNPLGVPDGGTTPQGIEATDQCNGGVWGDVTDAFYGSWSTANPAIATVDHYGTHTGVSDGGTTSQTCGSINDNDERRGCPLWRSCPTGQTNTNCVVPLYSGTCSVQGSETVLACGWGGPNTCCNPTIKYSAYYAASGHSCVNNAVQWTVGHSLYSDSCCQSTQVDSDCSQIFGNKVCETITSI